MGNYANYLLLLIVIAAALLFYAILQTDLSGVVKFALVFAEMLLVSQYLIKKYKLSSEMGLVLLKKNGTIEIIERLANKQAAFNFMADVGNAICYGMLSIFLMRRTGSAASLIAGLCILGFLTVMVAPASFVFLYQVLKIGSLERTVSVSSAVGGDGSLSALMIGALLVTGGLFLFVLAGIVFYGIVVFSALVKTLFLGSNAIANTAAGGAFLLPGINLPFVEGVLALAVVLVVHEGAHAILARIAKIPILSSGLVLFGIIPVGAFVEPDEHRLVRTETGRQTRVLVAGATANLLTSVVCFIIFMLFFFATPGFREQGFLVVSGLPTMPNGTVIHAVNGIPISPNPADISSMNLSQIVNITANSTVTFSTNHGEITKVANSTGKLGISYVPVFRESMAAIYSIGAFQFIYTFLGLAFALNFIVGTVNLLPVPLFDGHRIIDINVQNKMLVKVLTYGTIFFFVLNFLPMLFH